MSDKPEKKSRAGRKPKPESEKLSVHFMVRLTPSQADRLKAYMAVRNKSGEDMSDVVRYAIDKLLSGD
jgi:hypothetical protein